MLYSIALSTRMMHTSSHTNGVICYYTLQPPLVSKDHIAHTGGKTRRKNMNEYKEHNTLHLSAMKMQIPFTRNRLHTNTFNLY